ncbi:tail fiber assembly protein [Chromobacterium violaceum]|uniref:tail fiber assembly protein n=1 Tax=Chromobacterium violaceum TaxID=536 RepID=UPI0015F82DDF|nr:tail fiber assembly protein [Chromobacterium violaceum]MBA8735353.1 tail fiber assembly protein [Chromobacterium violaceum]
MTLFASKSQRGFYDDLIHDPLPIDAREISYDLHNELMLAQSSGLRISWDGDLPSAQENIPQPANAQTVADELAARRARADSAIVPLQDAADLGIATPAETALLTAWRRYRVLLSRLPQQAGFPTQIDWPPPPA